MPVTKTDISNLLCKFNLKRTDIAKLEASERVSYAIGDIREAKRIIEALSLENTILSTQLNMEMKLLVDEETKKPELIEQAINSCKVNLASADTDCRIALDFVYQLLIKYQDPEREYFN